MCITLLSTSHPKYPFILLSNRDEFLNRPTAHAHWWDPPNEHVLGGRDLKRLERGTWLGITKQGRIANLTNFRDEGVEVASDKSRGGLVNAYLTTPPDATLGDETFVKHLVDDVGIHNVGGFTLLFGELRAPNNGSFPGLAAISNRTSSTEGIVKIASKPGETHGLSNSHFGDSTWPKVVHGEKLLKQTTASDAENEASQEALVNSLFGVLSVDSLPRPKQGEDFQTYTRQLRNSILIPPVGGKAIESKPADKVAAADSTNTPNHGNVKVGEGIYGTQKQTVILVDSAGHVTYIERTLYDSRGHPSQKDEQERRFDFDIDGWDS